MSTYGWIPPTLSAITHLLGVTGRVSDGVKDTADGPDTAEGCSDFGVLHAGDEGAREDHGQALEGVLVGTWESSSLAPRRCRLRFPWLTLGAIKFEGGGVLSGFRLFRVDCPGTSRLS